MTVLPTVFLRFGLCKHWDLGLVSPWGLDLVDGGLRDEGFVGLGNELDEGRGLAGARGWNLCCHLQCLHSGVKLIFLFRFKGFVNKFFNVCFS